MRDRPPLVWAALAIALAFVAWHWARIESPAVGIGSMVLMALLGVAPAVAALARGRAVAAVTGVVCAVVAVGAATGVWPWRSGIGYLGDAYDPIARGARLWFQTHTPFSGGQFASLDADVKLAFFALAGAMAWLLLVRRWPVPAIAVAFLGFALPSTVVVIGAPGFRAALFLAIALLILRALVRLPAGGAGSGQALGVGTAVVAAALIVSALPGVNKAAFLNWHSWNPLAKAGPQVGVSYVWNQTYAPLHWPKKETTVLEVWAPHPMYWRVATLDLFNGTRWVERQQPITGPSRPGTTLQLPGALLPPNAVSGPPPAALQTIRVRVDGLAEQRLVSAGQPLVWHSPGNASTVLEGNGGALVDHILPRGTTYTSEIYNPDPSITDLRRAGGTIPVDVAHTATFVNGKRMRLWPRTTPGRVPLDPMLIRASDQVWRRSGAALAPNQWLAAAYVEAYLRRKPFVYDERPRYRSGVPVLADFLLRSHHGYCQMYSGAMGLVLRLHGIPTRIGVGFTTGVRSAPDAPYVVTDHDAHAWVEVYFAGWGWQQFDPTPTRQLPSRTSTSSQATIAALKAQYDNTKSAATKKAIDQLLGGTQGPNGIRTPNGKLGQGHGSVSSSSKGVIAPVNRGWHPGFISAAGLLGLALLALVALAKLVAIRARYLRRGPRARAAAAYHELSTFMGDQGVPPASSRTFEDLSIELDKVYGVDATRFARSASRARYGPQRGADRAEREMRKELRVVKRDLRRQLTPRERAAGALRLRAALSQTTSLD
jgi:protein-glutamine gamma-glutamyltransferase